MAKGERLSTLEKEEAKLKSLREEQSKIVEQEKELNKLKEEGIDLTEDQKKKLEELNEEHSKINEKLKEQSKRVENIRDRQDDVYDTLSSIAARVGKGNELYKEAEKILGFIQKDVSIVNTLSGKIVGENTKVADIIDNIQSGYSSIGNKVVESLGSLESSEKLQKSISEEIKKQEGAVEKVKEQLKDMKGGEDLTKQLEGQIANLKKMKSAAKDVSKNLARMDNLSELGNTRMGEMANQILKITKLIGLTKFGNIEEMVESLKEKYAEAKTKKLANDIKPGENKDTKIENPNEEVADTLKQQHKKDNKFNKETKKYQNQDKGNTKKQSLWQKFISRFFGSKTPQESKVATNHYQKMEQYQKLDAKEQKRFRSGVKSKMSRSGLSEVDAVKQTAKERKISSMSDQSVSDFYSPKKSGFGSSIGEKLRKTWQGVKNLFGGGKEETKIPTNQQNVPKPKGPTPAPKGAGGIGRALGGIGGRAMMAAGAVAAWAGVVIGIGFAIKKAMEYYDSMERVTDQVILFGMWGKKAMSQYVTATGEATEKLQKMVKNTKEYRKLEFRFTVKAALEEQKNVTRDYFEFAKQQHLDYIEYQNSLIEDNMRYEMGLIKDIVQFRHQQESANLDAELDRRKTLAGTSLGYIKEYLKTSERALNAIGSSTKAIMDGIKGFQVALGSTPGETAKIVEDAQGIGYLFGTSADEVLNMTNLFRKMGKISAGGAMKFVKGLDKFAKDEGLANSQVLFDQIKEASADIYRFMSGTPEQIAKQAAQLSKMGGKFASIVKASDTMVLNYKDSIKAEMSLSSMIGRGVNFGEARARMMMGDMPGGQDAIKEQLDMMGDISKLNPFAKQELTRATGMGMDELMAIQQGKSLEEVQNAAQLKQAEMTGKSFADAVLKQEISNAGAKLALEQRQRKEMLELEQKERLVMLQYEQQKRLRMIPIESQYRVLWEKKYEKEFAKKELTLEAVEELLTSTMTKYVEKDMEDMAKQFKSAYNINFGAPNATEAEKVLGSSVSNMMMGITELTKSNLASLDDIAAYQIKNYKAQFEFNEKLKQTVDPKKREELIKAEQKRMTDLFSQSFGKGLAELQKNTEKQNERLYDIAANYVKLGAGSDFEAYRKKYKIGNEELEQAKEKYVGTKKEIGITGGQYGAVTKGYVDTNYLKAFDKNYGALNFGPIPTPGSDGKQPITPSSFQWGSGMGGINTQPNGTGATTTTTGDINNQPTGDKKEEIPQKSVDLSKETLEILKTIQTQADTRGIRVEDVMKNTLYNGQNGIWNNTAYAVKNQNRLAEIKGQMIGNDKIVNTTLGSIKTEGEKTTKNTEHIADWHWDQQALMLDIMGAQATLLERLVAKSEGVTEVNLNMNGKKVGNILTKISDTGAAQVRNTSALIR